MKPPQEAAQIAPLLVVSYCGHLCVVRESGIVSPQLPPPPAEALRRDLSLALALLSTDCVRLQCSVFPLAMLWV